MQLFSMRLETSRETSSNLAAERQTEERVCS